MLKGSEDLSETILVIEDNDDLREVLTYVSQECGYRVDVVTKGRKPLRILPIMTFRALFC